MFKKSDLKTGMFGVKTNGELFVVINETLVYQNGDFDQICEMNNNTDLKTMYCGLTNTTE